MIDIDAELDKLDENSSCYGVCCALIYQRAKTEQLQLAITNVLLACGVVELNVEMLGGPMCVVMLDNLGQSYLEMKHRLEGLEK